MATLRHLWRMSVVAAGLLAVAGCKTSWKTETAQPPLNLGPDPVGRTSLPLSIQLSDMHLPRRMAPVPSQVSDGTYRESPGQRDSRHRDLGQDLSIMLPNTAYLVVVNEDRIRARVRLMHRWKEMTDVHRWKAWLEIEDGPPTYPSSVEKRKARSIHQIAVPEYDRWSGKPTGFVFRVPVDIWDGGGDYVFYKRKIFSRNLRKLSFVMQRKDYEFRYTWHFVDGERAGVQTTVSRGSRTGVTSGS